MLAGGEVSRHLFRVFFKRHTAETEHVEVLRNDEVYTGSAYLTQAETQGFFRDVEN